MARRKRLKSSHPAESLVNSTPAGSTQFVNNKNKNNNQLEFEPDNLSLSSSSLLPENLSNNHQQEGVIDSNKFNLPESQSIQDQVIINSNVVLCQLGSQLPVELPKRFTRSHPLTSVDDGQFEERENAVASGSGIRRSSDVNNEGEFEGEFEGSNSDNLRLDGSNMLEALQKIDQDADAAFTANMRYQSEILAVMKKLARAMVRTDELKLLTQDMHNVLEKGSESVLVAPGTVQISKSWFKHFHGQELPPNPEGEARDLYLSSIRHLPWIQPERDLLRSEVIAYNNREVARKAMTSGQDVDEALAQYSSAHYISSIENLDWEKIALPFIRRSAMDCKIQWLQVDHPEVNKGKWSIEELEAMYDIAIAKNERDWAAIATELNTGRTAAECLRRYRQRPNQERKDWTQEEDDKLRQGIAQYGLSWQTVADHVGRNFNQCITRWTNTLDPAIKKGKWTPQEDAILFSAVHACTDSSKINWKHVGERLGGRTGPQCRERWVNRANPKLLSMDGWEREEDERLWNMRAEGKRWTEIALTFGGQRTDNHCMRRYDLLLNAQKTNRRKPPTVEERKVFSIAKKKAKAEAEAEAEAEARGERNLEEEVIDELEPNNINFDPAGPGPASIPSHRPLPDQLEPSSLEACQTAQDGPSLNKYLVSEILVGPQPQAVPVISIVKRKKKKSKVTKAYRPRVVPEGGKKVVIKAVVEPRRSDRSRKEKFYDFIDSDDEVLQRRQME